MRDATRQRHLDSDPRPGSAPAPGKRTRSQELGGAVQRRSIAAPRSGSQVGPAVGGAVDPRHLDEALGFFAPADRAGAAGAGAAVQLHGGGDGGGGDVHAVARAGVSGPGQSIPHAETIQRAFGPDHDLSGVTAHVGGPAGAAATRLGATAYAMGEQVAFGSAPDLHLTAHEATHVVQQRAGVDLPGGVGAAGDPHERQADAVADRVVAGQSAADLLPSIGGGAAGHRAGVQKAGEGLQTPGGLITDWATAVSKIAELYTGVSTGVAWQKSRGISLWYEQARRDDPPPVWTNILIGAVGMAAAAGVAGYGAVLTKRLVTDSATKLLRARVAASIDVGKNLAKSGASAAVSKAMAANGSDGRLVYREALLDDVDAATKAESDAMGAELSGMASAEPSVRWAALQALYQAMSATVTQAKAQQYAGAVEGWMSASAQRKHGTDFRIGTMTLLQMYRKYPHYMNNWQSIQRSLQVQPNPDLSRLAPDHKASLRKVLGADFERLPVERVTDAESVASSGTGALRSTSTTGVIELHLETPLNQDPSIDYVEIESATGINDHTRNYFVGSNKRLIDFAVPKLLIGSDFRIGFDESAGAGVRTNLAGDDSRWMLMHGARKMGETFQPHRRRVYLDAAIRSLRRDLLGKSFRGLGVRKIGR